MLDWLVDAQEWIRAFHVISVIAWMAGMLYLPRLFVYHADAEIGSAQSATFKVMERRLLRGIINPAMIAAFAFGGLLLATPGIIEWDTGWIWVKLGAVLVLSAFHGFLARWRRNFALDDNRHGAKFYRAMNEVPTVLLVVIVIMVIVRPF